MTGRCDECREQIGGFVLSALEPTEMEQVREHLLQCEDCRRERDRLAGVLPLLDLVREQDVPERSPDPALESMVVARYRHERRRWSSRMPASWRGPLAGAVAGAALVTAAFLLPGLGGGGGERLTVELTGSARAAGASGAAELRSTDAGTRVDLRVRSLQPTRRNEIYELWLVGPGGRTSAGTFRISGSGEASLRMTAAVRIGDLRGLGVTREPDERDPDRNGPNVLAGKVSG